ncbi:MAG: insulinase family protein, partial [Phycisphaerales bacterium]
LNIQKSQVDSLVHERLRAAMFGDHPYGRAFPTEKMLNGYGIKAIKSFYESNFGAHRTHVYVVGRFDEKEMKAAIGRNLSNWQVGRAPLINVPKPSFENAVHLIDRPGAIQSTICIGIPVADPSHEDHPAVAVADGLLGGAMMSRITRNIREEKGYTYDTFSHISARYRNAYWVLTAAVTTDVTGAALGEIFGEIRRLRSEPPPEEELKNFRNLVSGLYVLWNASPAAIASQLSFLDLHGLDGSYPIRYIRNVHAVTPLDVQEVSQTYWRDDRILIVVAGDREKIYDQLRPFGSIVVD